MTRLLTILLAAVVALTSIGASAQRTRAAEGTAFYETRRGDEVLLTMAVRAGSTSEARSFYRFIDEEVLEEDFGLVALGGEPMTSYRVDQMKSYFVFDRDRTGTAVVTRNGTLVTFTLYLADDRRAEPDYTTAFTFAENVGVLGINASPPRGYTAIDRDDNDALDAQGA